MRSPRKATIIFVAIFLFLLSFVSAELNKRDPQAPAGGNPAPALERQVEEIQHQQREEKFQQLEHQQEHQQEGHQQEGHQQEQYQLQEELILQYQ
ncbi:hypothetical protein C1645_308727 [Glomus cerebriforme]|uniref:Uncharacterized protein n=1 Tax=Glomus cerebriforme TaxID=658196 RepID=A0A397SLW9_9GLOM|nr:hypothetical protein C1645_308727 [Glomus cerebriforme]